MKRRWMTVSDLMQDGYIYALTVPAGRDFDPSFKPDLTPGEMLRLGIFGGKYMTDCTDEFPAEWFEGSRLCHERHDPALNCFGVNASLPLSAWRKKDEFTMKTRGVGFNGTTGTTWGEGARTMSARSGDGGP